MDIQSFPFVASPAACSATPAALPRCGESAELELRFLRAARLQCLGMPRVCPRRLLALVLLLTLLILPTSCFQKACRPVIMAESHMHVGMVSPYHRLCVLLSVRSKNALRAAVLAILAPIFTSLPFACCCRPAVLGKRED